MSSTRRCKRGSRWTSPAHARLGHRRPRGRWPACQSGIKDIFDVAGLPTRFGAGEFAWRNPERDSSVVAKLRAAGELSWVRQRQRHSPTSTRRRRITPGTWTTRPWVVERFSRRRRSRNGCAGYRFANRRLRPAPGRLLRHCWPQAGSRLDRLEGVHALAPSLDHAGVFTRSVEDAAIAYRVLPRALSARTVKRKATRGQASDCSEPTPTRRRQL